MNGREEGAMVVLLGVLLMATLGLVALAVDSGRLVQERFQLQDGADAAALAIALDCATTGCPSDPAAVAMAYLAGSSDDRTGYGDAAVAMSFTEASGTVEVEARNPTLPLSGPRGAAADVSVAAAAVASWGPAGTGTTAPLAFADCVLGGVPPLDGSGPGTVRVRQRGVDGTTPACGDDGAGAALLRHDDCDVASSAMSRDWLRQANDAGPTGLASLRSDCSLRIGDRLPVAVFDETCTTGPSCPANESYRVTGYAFFEISGFHDCPFTGAGDGPDLRGECISGRFFPGVLPGRPIGGGAYGASTVRLELSGGTR
jgi:Flp pilus assembly protein TadG